MNFDLDDPLGDILSDGSNDSFFETTKKPTPKAPRQQQKANTASNEPNKKMADLFGIKNDDQKTALPPSTSKPNPFDTPPLSRDPPKSAGPSSIGSFKPPPKEEIRKQESPAKQPKSILQQKRDTSFDDDNDDIDLGFDLKKLKSKTGIFDDLLGLDSSAQTSAAQTRPRTTPNPVPATRSTVSTASKSVTSTSQPSDSGIGSYAPSVGRPRTGRRPSLTLPDPLGLFSTDEPKKSESKKIEKSGDWLGLDTQKNKQDVSQTVEEPQKQIPITPQAPVVQAAAVVSQPVSLTTPSSFQFRPDPVQTAQILNLSNRETETALQELKQQELQVVYATQIKNQENVLYEMQKR